MTIANEAPAWLVAALLILLALAAIEDGWRMRISNLLVLAIAATGIGAMINAAIGWQAWEPLVAAAAILAVGTPLFARGWMGGGDVKLLSASALWFMLNGSWRMLAAVAVAGGIVALIAILVRLFRFSDAARERVAMLQRGKGVPYGIAVALGVAATVMGSRSGLI